MMASCCKRDGVHAQQVFRAYFSGPDEGPLFVLLHGGGHSALSWAATVNALCQTARVLAFDFRGHGPCSLHHGSMRSRTRTRTRSLGRGPHTGNTHTSNDSDLSIETLTNDVITLLGTLYPASSSSPSPIILVGHRSASLFACSGAVCAMGLELCGRRSLTCLLLVV
jgi:protein phosphatase methylesterase 1